MAPKGSKMFTAVYGYNANDDARGAIHGEDGFTSEADCHAAAQAFCTANNYRRYSVSVQYVNDGYTAPQGT